MGPLPWPHYPEYPEVKEESIWGMGVPPLSHYLKEESSWGMCAVGSNQVVYLSPFRVLTCGLQQAWADTLLR